MPRELHINISPALLLLALDHLARTLFSLSLFHFSLVNLINPFLLSIYIFSISSTWSYLFTSLKSLSFSHFPFSPSYPLTSSHTLPCTSLQQASLGDTTAARRAPHGSRQKHWRVSPWAARRGGPLLSHGKYVLGDLTAALSRPRTSFGLEEITVKSRGGALTYTYHSV